MMALGHSAPAAAQTAGSQLVILTESLDAPDGTVATATTTTTNIKKVVNGQFSVEVDNGWVIYQGAANNPTLNFYDTDLNGNFNPSGSIKLKTANAGTGTGDYFSAGGVVFAPCPAGQGKCADSGAGGNSVGVGVGFGELIVQGGGQGSSNGGWVNDDTFTAQFTETPFKTASFNPGSISGVAVDPTNGAYAVGWDLDPVGGGEHAIVLTLDSAGQTYAPTARTDLGTLGGASSFASAISKGATYVVGAAELPNGKQHAVYATVTGTSWTDITTLPNFPTSVNGAAIVKSHAYAASDTGFLAGTVTVKESTAGRTNIPVDIGFVYNLSTSSVSFFPATGANVEPLQVLANGEVVGNLDFVLPKGTSGLHVMHPFLFDGSTLHDFGVMTLASTGLPAYGCRANRPNHLGEMVGTCTPAASTAYGTGGTAFYINALAATPAFEDMNATVHAREDAGTPAVKPYSLGTASSIDDEDEVTLVGFKVQAQTVNRASFLVSKNAYQ